MAAAKTQPKNKKDQGNPEENAQPVVVRREPEKTLFTWRAKARPFKRRTKEWWTSVFAIASVASFMLFIIEGAISVILVISIVFLYYVLSTVQPEIIEYSVTTQNVKIEDKKTPFQLFTMFWFAKRFDDDVIAFDMVTIPGRLELVINAKDKEKLREVFSAYLPEEEASPSRVEKTADWLSQKIPSTK